MALSEGIDVVSPRRATDKSLIPIDTILTPHSQEEVAEVIKEAVQNKKTLLPFGGGTDLFTAGRRFDIGVDMKGLIAGFRHTPEDLTATVPAGMALSQAQERLASAGQWIPLDPPDDGRTTVGGVVCSNRSGPRRHRYGTARDWVIATTVVNGEGKIVKAGANVVKNVSGYDLNKAYIGARGTLGIVLDVTFKLAPLPERRSTFRACFSSSREAFEIGRQIDKAHLDVESMVILKGRWTAPRAKHWWLLVELMGTSQSVQEQSTHLLSILSQSTANRWGEASETDAQFYWRTARFGHDEPSPAQVQASVSLPKSKVERFIAHIVEEDPDCSVRLLPGRGTITLELGESLDRTPFLKQIRAAGGTAEITGEMITTPEDRWPIAPPSLPLMKRLKKRLDPHTIFAPGTFTGGI